MKKTVVVLVSILALLSGACSQIPGLTPTPGTGPTVNPDDQFKTAIAETLTARPSPTSPALTNTATLPALDTETPSPSASSVISNTDASTATQTTTPILDLSATSVTGTANVPTATGVPGNLTPTLAGGQVTPIWTLAIRTYGTLPPAVPFSNVTLVNKAKTEAYISLQVTMPNGEYSILEYPVEGRFTIKAPVGSYLYVTWVGGRKMVGEFRLKNNDDVTITLYRNRVVVQ
jgi:hypothetical protein